MAVKLTNDTGINLPMAVWLTDDNYDYNDDPEYISATTLLKPIREIVLSRQHLEETKAIDISGFIQSQLGDAIHAATERAWTNKRALAKGCEMVGIAPDMVDDFLINPTVEQLQAHKLINKRKPIPVYLEQRATKRLDGWTVGGKFDLVIAGELHDYKSTSTFTYVNQTGGDKYIKQGSMYRWLNPDKITNDVLTINYLFTDWTKWKVGQPNYPQYRVMEQYFDLMPPKEIESWMKGKLALITKHLKSDQKHLPRCTDEELWKKESKWKYFKNPQNVRATKVYDTAGEANDRLRKEGCGVVKEFPGMAKACSYCSAEPFCDQAIELRKAGLLE